MRFPRHAAKPCPLQILLSPSQSRRDLPKDPAGNRRGQQVLYSFAMVSVSNKGVTLDLPNSPVLWAQTPLLIRSTSPGKPITWKTQLLCLTVHQNLPRAQ